MSSEKFLRLKDALRIMDEQRETGESEFVELPTLTVEQIVERLWIDVRVESPKKSGFYLVKYKSGSSGNFVYADVHYSKVHNRWNLFDNMDPEKYEEYKVDYFMEVRI